MLPSVQLIFIKMVVSKHLTYSCYPIWPVLYQDLNSHAAYPGIPPEKSNHTRGQYQHLISHPLLRLVRSKSDKTSSPEIGFSTTIPLELYLVKPHCARITCGTPSVTSHEKFNSVIRYLHIANLFALVCYVIAEVSEVLVYNLFKFYFLIFC